MQRVMLVLVALLCACDRHTCPLGYFGELPRTVEGQLCIGYSLVDLTLEGPPREVVEGAIPGQQFVFIIFSASARASLGPGTGPAPGERLEIGFPRAVPPTGMDAGSLLLRHPYDGGVLAIETGRRYIAAMSAFPYRQSELWRPQFLASVDENERIVQPFLEFPAGTPVSVVLDPRNVPADLLTRFDAGASHSAD